MKLYSSISVPLCTLKSDTRFCFALYHSHAMWDCQHILWVFLVFICFSCFFVVLLVYVPQIFILLTWDSAQKNITPVSEVMFSCYM